MGVSVEAVDELVRFTATVNGAAAVQDLLSIVYLDPAVAIEAGMQMARLGDQILRDQASRVGARG